MTASPKSTLRSRLSRAERSLSLARRNVSACEQLVAELQARLARKTQQAIAAADSRAGLDDDVSEVSR